jgi:hypothetical protein
MAMSKRAIDDILARHGYRAVSGETDADSPTAAAEASSPSLDSLRRRYAEGSPAPPLRSTPRSGDGAVVVAEPLDGRSPRKVFVLSDDDVVGEQG